MRILVLPLALLFLLPVILWANTPATGAYQIVVCGEEKKCEAVSTDFDYSGDLSGMIAWINRYDREYHADDLLLLRKLPLRQAGVFEESHSFQKKLVKFLEFEQNPSYYIASTGEGLKAATGFEITQTDMDVVNDYLDWYVAYYDQTDGLRNSMIKLYFLGGVVLIVAVWLYGIRKYRKSR